MQAPVVERKWYRSRHTGRYFIFGIAWVEKINSYRWKAGFLSGKRKNRSKDSFKSKKKACNWIEKLLDKDLAI